jgi:hypothetical protein
MAQHWRRNSAQCCLCFAMPLSSTVLARGKLRSIQRHVNCPNHHQPNRWCPQALGDSSHAGGRLHLIRGGGNLPGEGTGADPCAGAHLAGGGTIRFVALFLSGRGGHKEVSEVWPAGGKEQHWLLGGSMCVFVVTAPQQHPGGTIATTLPLPPCHHHPAVATIIARPMSRPCG